jgi:hypothetical protein
MILADLYSAHKIKLAIKTLPIIQTKVHNQKPRKKIKRIKNRQVSKKIKKIKNRQASKKN